MDKNSFEFRRGERSGKAKAFKDITSFLRKNNIYSLRLIIFLTQKLKELDKEMLELEREFVKE